MVSFLISPATMLSKKIFQSLPLLVFKLACVHQTTRPPALRTAAAMRLMLPQMLREAGTSAGAPGSQNVPCMSITTSADFLASSTSKR
ncbi:hypothetical protein D3C85_1360010 [compost metagenome]